MGAVIPDCRARMTFAPGILSCQSLEALVAEGAIDAPGGVGADQVQPASLDLRLGARAWRVRASFLPRRGRTVAERIADVAMHRLDLAAGGGAVLERGCVYIAQVQETLALPPQVCARANPKSSTGRVDLFVRLLTDGQPAFDDVAAGYRGPMFVEIAPQTFSVLVREGTRLNQLRLKRGKPEILANVGVGVDLGEGVVGFRARRHAGLIDMDLEAGLDPRDFWDALEPRRGELILDPGEFYILASKAAVEIRRWGSSGSTTPASSIPASGSPRRAGRDRAGCWRCAAARRRSCWRTARPWPAWCSSPSPSAPAASTAKAAPTTSARACASPNTSGPGPPEAAPPSVDPAGGFIGRRPYFDTEDTE
jgi:dCTP deaminase